MSNRVGILAEENGAVRPPVAPFNLEAFTKAQFDGREFVTQLDAEVAVRRAVLDRAERPLTSHELSYIDMAVALEWNRRKHALREHVSTNVAASVRAMKDANPDYYCHDPRCLWRVVTNRGMKPCPKHPARTQSTTETDK